MKTLKRIAALLLALTVLLVAASCAAANQPEETTAEPIKKAEDIGGGVTPDKISSRTLTDEDVKKLAEVYVDFFKTTTDSNKKSSLVSPLSIITALGMTADGAAGNTKAQFEKLFNMTTEQLDAVMNYYYGQLRSSEKVKFEYANSIWYSTRKDLKVKDSYISRVLGAYAPQLYTVDFGDPTTVGKINGWVDEHTDGMIKKIVDELDPATLMVLMNALVFDAKWADPYEDFQCYDRPFTSYSGVKKNVPTLNSSEYMYVTLDNAAGFVKNYEGGDYKFVALLPDEGVDVYDFVKSLDGASLIKALNSVSYERVTTSMPKFKYDYDITLNDALQSLGLVDAFTDYADFTEMTDVTEGNGIKISKVIHKTHIEVDNAGTKAAAVTAVIMEATSAGPMAQPKSVIIDRPFVYLIVDSEYNLPVFMGIVTEI